MAIQPLMLSAFSSVPVASTRSMAAVRRADGPAAAPRPSSAPPTKGVSPASRRAREEKAVASSDDGDTLSLSTAAVSLLAEDGDLGTLSPIEETSEPSPDAHDHAEMAEQVPYRSSSRTAGADPERTEDLDSGEASESAETEEDAQRAEEETREQQELVEEEETRRLERVDAEVKAHEQAHLAASGGLANGAASYQYVTGPDGRQYAVAGEVSIETSFGGGDPDETIQKAQQVRNAALAPANPSAQDIAVAAQATRAIADAMRQKSAEQNEELSQATSDERSPLEASQADAEEGTTTPATERSSDAEPESVPESATEVPTAPQTDQSTRSEAVAPATTVSAHDRAAPPSEFHPTGQSSQFAEAAGRADVSTTYLAIQRSTDPTTPRFDAVA